MMGVDARPEIPKMRRVVNDAVNGLAGRRCRRDGILLNVRQRLSLHVWQHFKGEEFGSVQCRGPAVWPLSIMRYSRIVPS